MKTNHPTYRFHLHPLLRTAALLGAATLGFAGVDAPKSPPDAEMAPTTTAHIDAVTGPIPTEAAKTAAISSNLPAGVTLKLASIKQTCAALHAAVLEHHNDAIDLLRIAILAKTPKQNDGRLPCPDLRRLVEAASTAAPDKTSQLIDLADSLAPDCADTLQNMVAGAAGDPGADGGTDAGMGPGTPGSPGFTGSAPAGAVALPTPYPVVTSTTNG